MNRPELTLFDRTNSGGTRSTSNPPQARQASSLDVCFLEMAALQAEIAALRVSTAKLRAYRPTLKPEPEPEP